MGQDYRSGAVEELALYKGRRGTRAGTRPAPTGPGRWKGESTRD